MTTCAKCPAWSYSHVFTENDKEVRIGYCRFEPPRVFREPVQVNREDGTTEAVLMPVGQWPPTRENHWCVRGRMLMELTGQSKPTALTADPGSVGLRMP